MKKYKITRSYIIKKYGSPNQSPQAIETSRTLQENHGQIIDCWYFEKNSTGYVITIYYFGGKFGTRSYVSFSVPEVY